LQSAAIDTSSRVKGEVRWPSYARRSRNGRLSWCCARLHRAGTTPCHRESPRELPSLGLTSRPSLPVPRLAVAGPIRFLAADVSAVARVPVPALATQVVDPGARRLCRADNAAAPAARSGRPGLGRRHEQRRWCLRRAEQRRPPAALSRFLSSCSRSSAIGDRVRAAYASRTARAIGRARWSRERAEIAAARSLPGERRRRMAVHFRSPRHLYKIRQSRRDDDGEIGNDADDQPLRGDRLCEMVGCF
jgi:hypothetical protein